MTWVSFGFLAFIAFCFMGYGSATDGARFIEALLMSGVVLSPAALFTLIRHTGRAITKSVMSHKVKQGRLYEKYRSEIDHMISVYGKSIDKIKDLIKSEDKNATKELIQLEKDIKTVEEKANLSLEQNAEVEKIVNGYISKYLTEAEKAKFNKIFKGLAKTK